MGYFVNFRWLMLGNILKHIFLSARRFDASVPICIGLESGTISNFFKSVPDSNKASRFLRVISLESILLPYCYVWGIFPFSFLSHLFNFCCLCYNWNGLGNEVQTEHISDLELCYEVHKSLGSSILSEILTLHKVGKWSWLLWNKKIWGLKDQTRWKFYNLTNLQMLINPSSLTNSV